MSKKIVVISLLLMIASSVLSADEVILDEKFENISTFRNTWGLSGNKRVERGTNYHALGGLSAQFTLNRLLDSVPYRSEYYLKKPNSFEYEEFYTIQFDVLLDQNWVSDSSGELVAQWHGRPDKKLGEQPRSPLLALHISDDNWYLVSRWDKRLITPNNGKRSQGLTKKNVGKIMRGKWTRWKFVVLFSTTESGSICVYKNNTKVAELKGPNAYNDKKRPYLKIGIYKWPWNPNSKKKWVYDEMVISRSLYFDNVKVVRNDNSLDAPCGF
jgi:hypothetical protein